MIMVFETTWNIKALCPPYTLVFVITSNLQSAKQYIYLNTH